MNTATLHKPHELQKLRGEWEDLCRRAVYVCPGSTWEWLEAWQGAFVEEGAAQIVTVIEDNRLLAALPLARRDRRNWGLGWREAGGFSNVHTQFGGLLLDRADAGAAAERLLRNLLEGVPRWDLLRIEDLPADQADAHAFCEAARRLGLGVLVQPQRQGPVLSINKTWDEYWTSLGRSFRDSTKRKVNKAQRDGLTVELHGPEGDPAELSRRAFEVAARSWSHQNSTSIISTPQLRIFFSRYIEGAAASGRLQMAFLRQGPQDLAFELNMDLDGRRYNFKMAYDECCKGASPGVVLRHGVLRDAFDKNIKSFHFLGDREAHKDHWADGFETFAHVTLFNRRIKPMTRYFFVGVVRPRIKRLIRPERPKVGPCAGNGQQSEET